MFSAANCAVVLLNQGKKSCEVARRLCSDHCLVLAMLTTTSCALLSRSSMNYKRSAISQHTVSYFS